MQNGCFKNGNCLVEIFLPSSCEDKNFQLEYKKGDGIIVIGAKRMLMNLQQSSVVVCRPP
jgi:hypothetical protein